MNMVAPDDGKEFLIRWLLNMAGDVYPEMTLHGFVNDITPDNDTVTGDFTEGSWTGYATVPILRSEMNAVSLTAHIAYITRDTAPEFECTGGSPQTLYGWYLTEDDTDVTVLTQRFETPREMSGTATEKIDPFRVGLQTLH